MDVFTFLFPLLDKFQQGSFFRTFFSYFFRILGVLIILIGIYAEVQLLKGAFRSDETIATIAGLLAAAIIAGLIFTLFQISFYRAKSIDELGDSDFTVIPIMAILIRYIGEVFAANLIFLGVVSGLTILIAGNSPYVVFFERLAHLSESQFLNSLVLILVSALAAVLVLTFFYFFSESLSVTVNIARNVRLLLVDSHDNLNTEIQEPDTQAGGCPKCGAAINPDDAFCMNCGCKLK